MPRIIRNAIRCEKCGDIIESKRERIMPEIQIEVCTTQVFGKSSV